MEEITKEELENLYVVENKTRQEVAEHFKVKPYIISNLVSKYGLKKVSQEDEINRIKQQYSGEELQDLYKSRTHAELAAFLGITADVLNRVLKDYGIGKRSKMKNLFNVPKEYLLDLYITQNLTAEEVANRLRTTPLSIYRALQVYGVKKPKSLVQQNINKTWQEKYGTTNLNLVPEIVEKREQTCLDRYGVKCYLISQECKSEFRNNSRPNREFAKMLESRGIKFEREFPIQNRSFDFKIGNILLDINPYGTHNSTWGLFGKSGKDPKYHQEKSLLASEAGYRCMHIWDWDDREKVIKMLLPKSPIYARKCDLREIPQREANKLLQENHLQGRAREQSVCLGLFYEENLVEVMTFGKPRFNKNYEWELIRLCTVSGKYVLGGAEKLFKYFIKTRNPKSIVSYCDRSKFSGEVYTRIGFTLQSSGLPSKHWYNSKTGVHVTDNGLRMQGFDRLFGEQYGKFGKGTSNEDLMRSHDFVEIWDAGQAIYSWKA